MLDKNLHKKCIITFISFARGSNNTFTDTTLSTFNVDFSLSFSLFLGGLSSHGHCRLFAVSVLAIIFTVMQCFQITHYSAKNTSTTVVAKVVLTFQGTVKLMTMVQQSLCLYLDTVEDGRKIHSINADHVGTSMILH